MAVSPNSVCKSFCLWVQATAWLNVTASQNVVITAVYTAANAGTTVTEHTWNEFLRTTGLWYQYYIAYIDQTTQYASLPSGIVQGDLLYGSAANVLSRLAKSATSNAYLKNSGTSNNPAWVVPVITQMSDYITTTDYSPSSTITGMNTFTLKNIYYSVYGNAVFVEWALFGKATATSVSFTTPHASTIGFEVGLIRIDTGTGAFSTVPGGFSMTGNTVTLAKDLSGAALTINNTVRMYGQFFYLK